MKEYNTVIAAIIIALSVFWYAETGKHQIYITDESLWEGGVGFVQLNTRTGKIVRWCNLQESTCWNWDLGRKEKHEREVKLLNDMIKQELKKQSKSED